MSQRLFYTHYSKFSRAVKRQCGLCFHRPYFCQISQLSGAYSKSCGQLTEKNAVEIEKQRSHPRRAQQCRQQAVRRRAIVTRASRSKARLRVVTKRRDPWRSHVHRTRFRRPRSSSSLKLSMQRGRGGRPLVLSLGGLRGILSFSKESIPLLRAAPLALHYPFAHRADQPVPLWAQKKSHPFGWLSFSLD